MLLNKNILVFANLIWHFSYVRSTHCLRLRLNLTFLIQFCLHWLLIIRDNIIYFFSWIIHFVLLIYYYYWIRNFYSVFIGSTLPVLIYLLFLKFIYHFRFNTLLLLVDSIGLFWNLTEKLLLRHVLFFVLLLMSWNVRVRLFTQGFWICTNLLVIN